MSKLILSIDQGTTSSRAIAFNEKGEIVSLARTPVTCLYPDTGWVECDANSIWNSVVNCIEELCSKLNMSLDDFDCIGITNQRETTVIWDIDTGEPIYHAIVWQSRQSEDICLRYKNFKDAIFNKTGLLIDPYFSASKISFILENVKGARKKAEAGKLRFGTIETWLLYKLSKGKSYFTDITNASRTMLFNIHTLSWDDELLKLFDIPKSMLPEVKPNIYDFGKASFFNSNTHIYAMAGDQQASLFGHSCFDKGSFKNTYGTGCFMLMNTGETPAFSKNGLITTIAWQINDKTYYALEGSVFIGGALIEWCKNKMKLFESATEANELALSSNGGIELYVVPAFVGLGAPYWDDDARGSVFGLTANASKEDFVRACFDSIAYQCSDVFSVMKKDMNCRCKEIKVDGGCSRSSYLMQFQADILNKKIKVPTCDEVTALGVCYMGGLKSGVFSSLEEIAKINKIDKTYYPHMKKEEIIRRKNKWKKAIKATRVFE